MHAVPTLIDLRSNEGEDTTVNVKHVECGNSFTICLTGNTLVALKMTFAGEMMSSSLPADDGAFWGCGTNKYGQLGRLQQYSDNPHNFVRLDIGKLDPKTVKNFKCHEWGTAMITE